MKMPPKKILGGPKKPGGLPRPPLARKPLQGRPAGKPLTARKKPADEELEASKAGAGASKKKVVLVGVIGVAAAAVIGVAAFFVLGGSNDEGKIAAGPKDGAVAAPAAEKKADAGTKAEEKAAATPEPAAADLPFSITDPLSILPKDAGFVAKLDAGILLSLPGAREGLEKKLAEDPQTKAILEESGFDPLSHLRTIWIAGEPDKLPPLGGPPAEGAAPGEPGADASVVVLVEGVFDKEKFIGALTKARKITRPKSVGRHEVHDITEGGGHLSLLTPEHLLIGEGKAFNDALKLTGGGPSVRENQVLGDLTGDFSSNPIAWAAIALPASLAGQIEAQLQAKVEGAFVSLDRSADGAGAAVEVLARCPSSEDVKKLEAGAQGLLAGLPPPVKLFLVGLKMQSEDKHLRISLELPEQLLQPLLSGGGAAPPEGGEEMEEAGDEEAGAEAGEEEKTEAEPGEAETTEPEAAEEEKAEPMPEEPKEEEPKQEAAPEEEKAEEPGAEK
jgi:hypothetical protein